MGHSFWFVPLSNNYSATVSQTTVSTTSTVSLQHVSLQHFLSQHLLPQLIAANATATIRSIFFITKFVLKAFK